MWQCDVKLTAHEYTALPTRTQPSLSQCRVQTVPDYRRVDDVDTQCLSSWSSATLHNNIVATKVKKNGFTNYRNIRCNAAFHARLCNNIVAVRAGTGCTGTRYRKERTTLGTGTGHQLTTSYLTK